MIGSGCRDIRLALGVYVLGAIEPAERAEVDEHLAVCLGCREELASLAGLPALLRRVPTREAERAAAASPDAEAADLDPGESMLPGLVARVAAARRARLWRTVAAAAAVVLVALGGGAAAGVLSGQAGGAPSTAQPTASGPVGAWQTVAGTDQATRVTLTVRYARAEWGTDMSVHVDGVRPGTVCQFVVTDAAGRHWTVGSWRVSEGAWSMWYPAATSLKESQIHDFALVAGHTVLARAAAR